MASIQLQVSGMACNHCRGKVETALQQVAGVYSVFVDLDDGSAEVDFDANAVTPEVLVGAVKSAGYDAQPVS
ncbi:MAG: hypothetical protein AMS18_13985 [Gemmatimonas sp. SG8_17]|nr:MAG: hypothetical protein AMS18_13985 [Gemmatimonas sp. SG8_17]